MNLIGKIFVAIILLLSVIFMILAMAAYSTHKNWQTAYATANNQLRQTQDELQRANSKHILDVEELQIKLDEAVQRNAELLTKNTDLTAEKKDIQEALTELTQQSSDQDAAVKSTQANNERLANENVEFQQVTIAAQEAADRAFQKTVEATADLHDAAVKLANEEEKTGDLTQQVADMTAVMRRNGIDPATRVGDTVPKVDGYVSLVRRRPGDETIEITIGSDDGIKKGHTIEVFRSSPNPSQSKWLGRAVVQDTSGDRAWARVVPELKKARIQEGDRVATRLN